MRPPVVGASSSFLPPSLTHVLRLDCVVPQHPCAHLYLNPFQQRGELIAALLQSSVAAVTPAQQHWRCAPRQARTGSRGPCECLGRPGKAELHGFSCSYSKIHDPPRQQAQWHPDRNIASALRQIESTFASIFILATPHPLGSHPASLQEIANARGTSI